MGSHGFHRTGLPPTVARKRYSSLDPFGRERSATTPPTRPSDPMTANAVRTATTAARPRRRRGGPTVGGSVVQARSGRPGTSRSGRRGGGGSPGSIATMGGAVSANAAAGSTLLAHQAPTLERPVHEDDLRLQVILRHRTEVARVGRAMREV